jgi:NADH-quinone oxidoreductase subunit N
MLILRLFKLTARLNAFWIAIIGSTVALYYAAPFEHLVGDGLPRRELFGGMLVYDSFAIYVRSILLVFVILFAVFTRLSGIPDREDSADFFCMVLGATIGLCLMSSANHLLVIFLAVEMASVPSYALAAMLKGRRQASEAALKYSIYGAGAAGVMLYGISLLAGMLNTAHLPTLAMNLSAALPTMDGPETMVLALAGLMVGVGLAFKLSAVPFHFWCPDVFEGASAEINAFLSVASKAGALALFPAVFRASQPPKRPPLLFSTLQMKSI